MANEYDCEGEKARQILRELLGMVTVVVWKWASGAAGR
jgi:endonuclease YncB( thermonuclease family)